MPKSNKNKLALFLNNIPMRIGILLIKIVGILPYPFLVFLGKGCGLLMLTTSKSRRQIAAKNLSLCYPELTAKQHRHLLIENFKSTGIGLMETAFSWTVSPKRLVAISELKGSEHLSSVLETGQGAIVLSFHLTSLEIGGNILANYIPIAAMYRQHTNHLFEKAMCEGRCRNVTEVIERSDIRSMIKALKSGKAVWYAADQDYGADHSLFAPFFNIPTATITATSRFVKLTRVPVIPMTHYRDKKTGKFKIQLHPKLDDFATVDDLTDATRINLFLEDFLRQHPEDYLWVHRRFKTRPDNLLPVYEEKSIFRMRTLVKARFEKYITEGELLEGTQQKPLLLKLPDGNHFKFIYRTHLFQKSPAKKYAQNWLDGANPEIKIIKLLKYPPLAAEVIRYQLVDDTKSD